MQSLPISTRSKRFLAPAFAGGIVGFIVFLMLTYPSAMQADLPLPPTLLFGRGPDVELQGMLLDLRRDLYWLTILLEHGFGFIGLFVLGLIGIAALIERIETKISLQTGKPYTIAKVPMRYLASVLSVLCLGLLLDLAWMRVSFHAVYLHFTCLELLCSQSCLGILVMFVHDELKKLVPAETRLAALKHRTTFRIYLAFAAMTYFLFAETFAWPCAWFLSSFPQLNWSELSPKEWIVVSILITIYTASTLYAAFAFLVLNRKTKGRFGDSLWQSLQSLSSPTVH
jgi:hypothetical protein